MQYLLRIFNCITECTLGVLTSNLVRSETSDRRKKSRKSILKINFQRKDDFKRLYFVQYQIYRSKID